MESETALHNELDRFVNEAYHELPGDDEDLSRIVLLQNPEPENSSDNRVRVAKIRKRHEKPVWKDRFTRCSICAIISFTLLCILAMFSVDFMYPSIPTYYVCNEKQDWSVLLPFLSFLSRSYALQTGGRHSLPLPMHRPKQNSLP